MEVSFHDSRVIFPFPAYHAGETAGGGCWNKQSRRSAHAPQDEGPERTERPNRIIWENGIWARGRTIVLRVLSERVRGLKLVPN